ncbi:YrbL family protein [Mesorhizobium sp. KR9-304]|uniref:YrbL family protein n=1 Tax=Mesorhizobium sp. KR9-304 TaxID=3156614 RepID=UPI0032B4DAE3
MTTFTPFLAGQEIDLHDCVLVKSGRTRNVHEHEALPGLLIKTLQPELVDRNGYFKAYARWKKRRPHGAYFAFRREVDEFIVLCRRLYGRDLSSLPIARIHGLVLTSAGLGLVVERIPNGDGLAPTMLELIGEDRFAKRHLQALERFLDRCRELHVVFGDLTVNNIVYSEARDPRGEFVAIDGFGEKSAIPIHRWSPFLNDRKIERVRSRLLAAVPVRLKEEAAA